MPKRGNGGGEDAAFVAKASPIMTLARTPDIGPCGMILGGGAHLYAVGRPGPISRRARAVSPSDSLAIGGILAAAVSMLYIKQSGAHLLIRWACRSLCLPS